MLAAIDHPARRLHRPPDGPQAQPAAGRRHRRRAVVARAVETGTALEINSQPDRLDLRDVHARLAGEAGVLVPSPPTRTRRGARLPRARRRAGEAGVADEGAGAQHAPVARGREAPQVSTLSGTTAPRRSSGSPRTSSACASSRALARRAGSDPRRAPGDAPETAEPFAAVLRDLDDVLLPGLTHWQSPRYFAYFATTGSEPGILAELLAAALNQVGILWRTSPALQELEEVTLAWLAELLGLPAGLHGHLEDTRLDRARHRARGRARRGARPARRRLLRAHALVDGEGGAAARARAPHGARRRRVRAAPRAPRPDRRLRGRRDRRDDVVGRGRSRRGARRPLRRRGRLAPRRRRVRGQRGRLPRAPPALRRLGAGRLDRRQPAQVALHADGLLGVLHAPAGGAARRVQPRPRVPPRRRGRRQPERVRACRSAGGSARSSSGPCSAATGATGSRR